MSFLPTGNNLKRDRNIKFPDGAGEVAVAWNPADISGAPWIMTNQNLNAISPTGVNSAINATRSLSTATAGKRYLELVLTRKDAAFGTAVRHDMGLTDLTPPDFTGCRADLAYCVGGAIFRSSVNLGAVPVLAVNDVVRFAFDFANLRCWIAVNGGAWLLGGGDPVAGTAPTVTGIAASTYFPTATYESAGGNRNGYRIQGNTSLLTFAPPSGYRVWGAV